MHYIPKSAYYWGLINIGIQFVMGWISVGFVYAIMIMFAITLFLGIASTEENVEKLKQYRFYA